MKIIWPPRNHFLNKTLDFCCHNTASEILIRLSYNKMSNLMVIVYTLQTPTFSSKWASNPLGQGCWLHGWYTLGSSFESFFDCGSQVQATSSAEKENSWQYCGLAVKKHPIGSLKNVHPFLHLQISKVGKD